VPSAEAIFLLWAWWFDQHREPQLDMLAKLAPQN
jgi:hypothetical protein